MNELPLELKIKISANFYPVWFFFATNDDQFIKYANSPAGVRQCIESFRGYTCGTTLFGRLHSFAGQPAYENDLYAVYYYNGEYHREDGGPAIDTHRCHWLNHGKYYRVCR